jgi:hypothetical protein
MTDYVCEEIRDGKRTGCRFFLDASSQERAIEMARLVHSSIEGRSLSVARLTIIDPKTFEVEWK